MSDPEPNLIEITELPEKDIKTYGSFNKQCFGSVIDLSNKLAGKPIIHINATAHGGGIAEMLMSQIPLERSLGLDSRWFTIKAAPEFFAITKKIHNLLQGKAGNLTEKEKAVYIETSKDLGISLEKILAKFGSGIVVLHDPQPMALINHVTPGFTPILRLHIDLSTPNSQALDFFNHYIKEYPLVILSNKAYALAMPWLQKSKIKIIYPSIDPLTDKNKEMSPEVAWDILEGFGINPTKSLITQVSRFDPWKDPLGVIHAYYIAKNDIPDLQLALAGFIVAQDDPEAATIFKNIEKHAKGDPDIYLFANPEKLGGISNDVFINALYTASTVVVQKSIREGFGLTMTEAMFKGKALVAGATLGALAQIKNGKNGVLVSSSEEAAEALVKLLRNDKMRERMGKAAQRSAASKFTILNMLLEHLKIYAKLENRDK